MRRAVELPHHALLAQRAYQSEDGKVPRVAEGVSRVFGVHSRVRRSADSGNCAGSARISRRSRCAMRV